MKRIVLLTGGTGFIGRQTIPFLLAKGYEIHALSTQIHQHPQIHWHQCNLLNERETVSIVSTIRATHLLHFAWTTKPGAYLAAGENLNWVEASFRLIESFVQQGGKRVVVAGSCAEYESQSLCCEMNNSFQGSTFYGQCKRLLCLQLEQYAAQTGLAWAWGYLFYLFGPYERPERLVPSIIRGILQKQPIDLTQGTQIRDFLPVKEAARAFVELLDSPVQGRFNIASGQGITIRELGKKITAKIGGEQYLRFGARPMAVFDPVELVADMSHLQKHLSWRRLQTLDEALSEAIEYELSHPF